MKLQLRATANSYGRPWISDRWLDGLIAWATHLSRPQAWAITALAVALAVSVSRLAGPEVWFGPLYLLIICLPAWAIGRGAAFLVGIACAGAAIAAKRHEQLSGG